MSVREESLKLTKNTYICERRIFANRPMTPMSVRAESLKPTKDTYVCQRRTFKPTKDPMSVREESLN